MSDARWRVITLSLLGLALLSALVAADELLVLHRWALGAVYATTAIFTFVLWWFRNHWRDLAARPWFRVVLATSMAVIAVAMIRLD